MLGGMSGGLLCVVWKDWYIFDIVRMHAGEFGIGY